MASDDTIDDLIADLRKRLRISDLARSNFAVRNEDVGRLLAEVERLRAALTSAKAIAFEAWGEWDSDNDSRVGKLLKALAGHLRGYRADIDAIHDATGGPK